jgi:hypothetical protein
MDRFQTHNELVTSIQELDLELEWTVEASYTVEVVG